MYVFAFFDNFLIYMPYLALFLNVNKGLTNNQIAIVFSAFSLTVFLFEIPTGFVADIFGAKNSLICSFAIRILGLILMTFSNSFTYILIGEFCIGLGSTFSSGADQSLLFKILKEQEIDSLTYNKIISRYYTICWLSITFSFAMGQFLAIKSYETVFIGSLFFTFLGFIWSFFLPNLKVKRENINSFFILKNAFSEVILNKVLYKKILLSSLIMAVLGSSYLLFQPYLNEIGMAGINNGILFFCITLFASLGSKIQPYFIHNISTKNIFPKILFILSCCIIIIGLVKGFLIFIVLCVFRLIWGIMNPLISTELNLAITNDQSRSTILSIQSLVSSLIQGIILFFVGIINIPISIKLIIIGLFLLPTVIYKRINKEIILTTSSS